MVGGFWNSSLLSDNIKSISGNIPVSTRRSWVGCLERCCYVWMEFGVYYETKKQENVWKKGVFKVWSSNGCQKI